MGKHLAVVYFPIAVTFVAHLEQAVLGVVTLAAVGADQESPQVSAFAVIIFGNGEGRATTAGDQEHGEVLVFGLFHRQFRPDRKTFSGKYTILFTVSLDPLRAVQLGSYVAGVFAAFWAVLVYRSNSRRERARWAENLYSRFYGKEELKLVRDLLDCGQGDAQVSELVKSESAAWTDYLNFFEFVAYLQSSKQLSKQDVEALFRYYLDCLKRHPEVEAYVRDPQKGYEYLRRIL